MDAFIKTLKRKRESEENTAGTGAEKSRPEETCPHAERCYRKNPHHFREFDHPHLNVFLEKGEPLVLPDGFPQEKQVVMEQLAVLKSLRKVSVSAKVEGAPPTPSASSSTSKSVDRTQKTTCFVANLPQNKTDTGGLTMLKRLEIAAPYNLFFTRIPESPETIKQTNSIAFTDLLCPSLGKLKSSLQINFMIDIMWLMEQYEAQNVANCPLTVVYGYEFPNMKEYMDRKLPNVTHHLVNMKDPFGTHHSKVGLYLYEGDVLRVVVSTANLYFEDWNMYNQGLWLSPVLPKLEDSSPDSEGESPTAFKSTLLNYLKTYNIPCLKPWIDHVRRANFSQVKVFLVTSTPGKHYNTSNTGCHLQRVADLLKRHCALPEKTTAQSEGPLSWAVMAQASSIGSLGKTPGEWLRKYLLGALSTHSKCAVMPANSNATINIVFPTKGNVLNSYYGESGGGCLPYARGVHEKQKWLKDYLHEWKADHSNRTRAMPHIKTYCRVSPCTTKLAWFLLTSSNISKSAWGGNVQRDGGVYVRSYEVGVMFLPKFFEEDYFPIKSDKKLFPFIYDIPLSPYKANDQPWTM